MSDILERLRHNPANISLINEAANEIERLRAAVKAWQEWHAKATSPGPSPSFAPVLRAMKNLEEGTR